MWRTIHPLCYLPPIHTLNKSQINDLPHSAIFHVGDKLFKRGQLPCSIRAAALPKMANPANVFYAAYRRPFDFHRVWCIWEFRRGTANRIRHNFPGAPFLPGKTAIQRRNLSLQVLILFQIFKGQVSSPVFRSKHLWSPDSTIGLLPAVPLAPQLSLDAKPSSPPKYPGTIHYHTPIQLPSQYVLLGL